MVQLTGAEAMVKVLEKEGVEYVFGLCGHANVSFLDALYDSSIKFISVRNEGSAVRMADAYFRASHKPAVVLTTVGPGITNTVTAVADAALDAAGVVVISGDVSNYNIGSEGFQEINVTADGDQWEILRPVAKRAMRVPDASVVTRFLERALNIAYSGRPGPVLVSVPMNFFSHIGDYQIDPPGTHRVGLQRLRGDREAIERAVELLVRAERPMLFAGNGVVLSEASPELIVLAEHLATPVATSLVGQGAFPKDHPLSVDVPNSVGNPVVSHAMKTADVVLAVGTRFGEAETCSWNPDYAFDPWQRQKLIQVDIVPDDIGKVYPVAVPIVGDAKAVLAEMLDLVQQRTARRDRDGLPWLRELGAIRDEWEETKARDEASDEVPIKVQRVLADLREVMPAGSIVLVDTGGFGYAVGQHLLINEPQTYYYNLGIGSMGPVMSAALGSKLARPDRKVVAITGDGGFTCEMSGLVTAVEYNIPVLYLVLNNYSYNSIEAYQHKHYDDRVLGTTFRDQSGRPYNPDFVAIAKACGADGIRVESPGDLPAALERGLRSDVPFVLDVVVAPTRFPKTYGSIEFNTFLAEEAEFKRERRRAQVSSVA